MMDWLVYPAAFVLVLAVLIVVHEWGHFAVARACGVRVLRFSVGFGKPLYCYQSSPGATEWVLGAFPLGGYVKMLDEREAEVAPADRPYAFNTQSLWKRSAIVAAGPVANLFLAFLIYWGCFWVGGLEWRPMVAEPPEASPAAVAKIFGGDTIRRVGQDEVRTWQEFRWALVEAVKDAHAVEIETETATGDRHVHQLDGSLVAEKGWEGDPVAVLGFNLFQPVIPPVIGKLIPGGPAEAAGLQVGDEVLSVDGKPVAHWRQLVELIRESQGDRSRIEVKREGALQTLVVQPQRAQEGGRWVAKIGVGLNLDLIAIADLRVYVSDPFPLAGYKALKEVWDKSIFSVVMLGKMLLGDVSWKNLSGPVTIADYAGQSAKAGWGALFRFMAVVSVSLGVLNLLPVPVLDGGHLLYHMIEAIKGSPLSEKTLEFSQRAGLAVLLSLMAFAFVNDISRLLS